MVVRYFKIAVFFFLSVLIGTIIFMVVPFLVHGQENILPDAETVVKAQKQAERLRHKLKISPEQNKYYERAKKEALKSYLQFKNQRQKEIEAYRKTLKELLAKKQETEPTSSSPIQSFSPAHSQWKHFLLSDERLYIFMSSSVPLVTWNNYAESLDKLREANAAMVLMGCIGGCTYFKPTLEFIKKIILPEGIEDIDFSKEGWQKELEKRTRHVQILIDPLLFRYYGITEVPCIVYAKGVNPLSGLSEGLPENLQENPQSWKICGDWKLSYMLEKLYEKSGALVLKRMAKELKKSWYESRRE